AGPHHPSLKRRGSCSSHLKSYPDPAQRVCRRTRRPCRNSSVRGSNPHKGRPRGWGIDRKSTRLNSSHEWSSYAVFCLKQIYTSVSFLVVVSFHPTSSLFPYTQLFRSSRSASPFSEAARIMFIAFEKLSGSSAKSLSPYSKALP